MATLEQLLSWVSSSEDATRDARELSERDRDYYDGVQWTDEERATLQKRGQPCITLNRIAPKIDFLIGSEMRSRTDPKAFPRTPSEDGAADVATQAIRYVCDKNNWNQERSLAYENMVVEGAGAVELRVEWGNGGPDIKLEHIPWDRLIWDPRSRHSDFRDAKYFGTIVWLDYEDAIARPEWQGKQDVIAQAAAQQYDTDETYDDRPHFGYWADTARGRRRVKVCQLQWKESNEWKVATFTSSGFLDEPTKSIYQDEFGNSVPNLILQSCKVNRNNERYGLVRPLISPQDEINKRRSKSLHLLSMRQVISERGAIDDPARARQELARPDGIVEVNPGMRFEIAPTADMAQGQVLLYQDAKAEMDAVGTNAALMGKVEQSESGRAIMARQQGGLLEVQKVFDGLRQWSLRVYRHVWYAIRQFWQHEMWVRVTDSEEHVRWLPLNRKITAFEKYKREGLDPVAAAAADLGIDLTLTMSQPMLMSSRNQLEGDGPRSPSPSTLPIQGGTGAPGVTDSHPAPPGDAQSTFGALPVDAMQAVMAYLQQVVDEQNKVAELDVDIILDEGPDTIVLQQEQFQVLADLARAGLPIPPEALIEASNLRNKRAVLDALKGQGVDPAMAQQQQKAAQLAELSAMSEIDKRAAETEKIRAETSKTAVETRRQVYDYAEDQAGKAQLAAMGVQTVKI